MKLNIIQPSIIKMALILSITILSLSGCKKYLDAKPDKTLQVPSTLEDLNALLNNSDHMNNASPTALELPADNYYLLEATYNSSTVTRQNLYIWGKDVFNESISTGIGDWGNAYVPVYRANVVLETLEKIPRNHQNEMEWDQVKGSALLYRARSFYEVAQVWAKAYDQNTASTGAGIPLRLTSDFNTVSFRATIQETYDQIIKDLDQAVQLLPNEVPHVMQPSKPAAYGYLARTYLAMQQYDKAGFYADLCLKIKGKISDYNTLTTSVAFPFAKFYEEVIFNTSIPSQTSTNNGRIDAELYASYALNDKRRSAFFKTFSVSSGGGIGFKGSYYGSNSLFNGIATDEMYLVRAESNARQNKNQEALDDLNALLIKRYATKQYQLYTLSNTLDVLRLVLEERRKELVFRGLQWSDLKRLNKETRFAKTIKRELNGKVYELSPNDSRYAIAIPNSVIEISGVTQN